MERSERIEELEEKFQVTTNQHTAAEAEITGQLQTYKKQLVEAEKKQAQAAEEATARQGELEEALAAAEAAEARAAEAEIESASAQEACAAEVHVIFSVPHLCFAIRS